MTGRNRISPVRSSVQSAAAALATFLFITVSAPSGKAQTFSTLYSFTGGADGANPHSDLVRDSAGNLYGTTLAGGTSGAGTVFKLDASGHQTVLHSFTGNPDGAQPTSGLVRDSAGNLYGTTQAGGTSGAGAVFKVDALGQETVLYSFRGGLDGSTPRATPILDAAGNLYGTTYSGGRLGFGTVYKLDPSGVETVLHGFDVGEGAYPQAGVIMDAAGNVYGTTLGCAYAACLGTVFKVDTLGNATVLHAFAGTDGSFTAGGLVMDATGSLYGTTGSGGASGAGTVFKLDASGNYSVLHDFTAGADGGVPLARLIMDAAGNLYGTTSQGGSAFQGTVFELDASGSLTVLHTFTGGSDGGTSGTALLPDAAGNLYGATAFGGSSNAGTVFKLTPKVTFATLSGLVSQYVTTNPLVQKVLLAELAAAQDAASHGYTNLSNWELRLFINSVTALSGRVLTAEQAAVLIQQATELMP